MYKNLFCVSVSDLTRDDRTWVDGVAVDETKAPIMSYAAYKVLAHRDKLRVVRRGARSTPALVEYASLPERFKERMRLKYGALEQKNKR